MMKFCDYKINSYIAHGADGVVCRLEHPSYFKGVKVAKILTPLRNDDNEEDIRKSLKRDVGATSVSDKECDAIGKLYITPTEINIMSRVDHPYIMRPACFHLPNGICDSWIIFMEEGRAAGSVKGLTVNDKLVLTCKLIQGLQALHGHGIVHRDLKPNNVLIMKNGDPNIIDFGVAEYFDVQNPKIKYEYQAGTYIYRPPEMFDDCAYGPYSDIWSMAITILEIMLGGLWMEICLEEKLQHEHDTDEFIPRVKKAIDQFLGRDTLQLTLQRMQPVFGRYVDGCIDLLGKMLNYDALKRPTATEILEHPLFKESIKVGILSIGSSILRALPNALYEWKEPVLSGGDIERHGRGWNVLLTNYAHHKAVKRITAETWFLALDIYYRAINLCSKHKNYSLACLILALATVHIEDKWFRKLNGLFGTCVLSDLDALESQSLLIRELGGEIYVPNVYTQCRTARELKYFVGLMDKTSYGSINPANIRSILPVDVQVLTPAEKALIDSGTYNKSAILMYDLYDVKDDKE